jgi:3-isopropylmalate dehydrogenase
MSAHSLLLLPGDGIGPEVMAEVERLIAFFNKKGKARFDTRSALVGGAAIDRHEVPLTEDALSLARGADAILFGAVGGPKWDKVAYAIRPEAGLLRLRKELDLFANLRPAICYPALAEASTLKREHVEGLDILILRELTGGTYFGEPKEIVTLESGQKRAVDTTVYTTHEIERIVRVAFDLARARRNKVHSAEKRNVMKTGVLWHEVVSATHAREAKDVELQHILADACAMQLVRNPKQFDVIVTGNLFGDILSDEASMLTGSIGMLPSASLDERGKGLYEPIHGSAPDIAGKGVANPLATILSAAMMLRYSLSQPGAAGRIEDAVRKVLRAGLRTADIHTPGTRRVGTAEMGAAVLEAL